MQDHRLSIWLSDSSAKWKRKSTHFWTTAPTWNQIPYQQPSFAGGGRSENKKINQQDPGRG